MKPHSVTEIVAGVYCEKKLCFDRIHGDRRPLSIRLRADLGTLKHKAYELESKALQAPSSPCFVASAVYGNDAPETNFLRAWRDRVLTPSLAGRIFVRIYYCLSPPLANLVRKNRTLTHLTRVLLDSLLKMLNMPNSGAQ